MNLKVTWEGHLCDRRFYKIIKEKNFKVYPNHDPQFNCPSSFQKSSITFEDYFTLHHIFSTMTHQPNWYSMKWEIAAPPMFSNAKNVPHTCNQRKYLCTLKSLQQIT